MNTCFSFPLPAPRRTRAFSLIEIVSVMALMTLLAGVTVPAVKGMAGSRGLDSGTRKIVGILSVARSEAIARHAVVRFGIAKDWAGKQDANLRKVGLWIWDSEVETFTPLMDWQELPVGVVVEPSVPAYVRDASYAAADASTVHGDCVLDEQFADSAEFAWDTGADHISTRYIEFLPSGNIRIPGGKARQALFVATQGYQGEDGSLVYTSRAGDHPANWAQINVDTLTGRVRVYKP